MDAHLCAISPTRLCIHVVRESGFHFTTIVTRMEVLRSLSLISSAAAVSAKL
jgi:hypothetical protein